MKDVKDVAAYILSKLGYVSTMKLQKLVYYSQVCFLVRHNTPLFSNKIEAWANGPVVRDLYEAHKGQFVVSLREMNFDNAVEELSDEETECIDFVLKVYGEKSGNELSDMTHNEDPWKDAREGLEDGESSNNEISTEAILSYYKKLNNCIFAA